MNGASPFKTRTSPPLLSRLQNGVTRSESLALEHGLAAACKVRVEIFRAEAFNNAYVVYAAFFYGAYDPVDHRREQNLGESLRLFALHSRAFAGGENNSTFLIHKAHCPFLIDTRAVS